MALPLLGPFRALLRARAGAAGLRAATAMATLFLVVMAIALLFAGALVALSGAIGFPAAACVFAAVLSVLALAVHLIGRALSAHQAVQVAALQARADTDIALVKALSRSPRPLLMLGLFLTAFALARRS